MRRRSILLAFLVAALLVPAGAGAQTGVGVNVGRIAVDEALSPGGSYTLPGIGVINTGGRASDYSLRITYRADQEELRPAQGWFTFHPEVFHLEPGESRTVSPRVHLPPTARPGDYFAVIEAFPVADGSGGVAIGVAAGTRLNFTVKPSNPVIGSVLWTYHRFEDGAPFSYAALGLLVLFVAYLLLRRFVRFQFRVERR
jgi:hypothetical protein